MATRRAIFFDTETTGTNPQADRIIELAAFDAHTGQAFERLINPGITIPPETIMIHQITNDMVKDAPSFEVVAKEFLDFCQGDVALIAHNADSFDAPFLRHEFKRNNLFLPHDLLFIDSLKWSRRYRRDLPRHSLQFLRQTYGIESNQAHRALNDVMTLMHVFKAMTDDLSCETIAELLKISSPKEAPPQIIEAPKVVDMTLNLF